MIRTILIALSLSATPILAQEIPAIPTSTSAPASAPSQELELPKTYSFRLANGDVIVGKLLTRDDGKVVIQHESLGELTIPAGNVAQIIEPKGEAPAPKVLEKAGIAGSRFFRGWDRELSAGLTGSSGNSEALAFNAQLALATNNDRYRSKINSSYFYSKNDGESDRNEFRLLSTYDRKIEDSKYFVFGQLQYDHDSFESWRNRLQLFAGPGYTFYERPKYGLIGRAGLGFTEYFATTDEFDDREFALSALLSVEGYYKFTDKQRLTYSAQLTPSLYDFPDQGQTLVTAAYVFDLDAKKSIKLGIEHEYEFQTPGDEDHNDWKYFANLVIKF